MSKISFCIPCYRSEKTIAGVVAEIKTKMTEMSEYKYEIVLVNDCSPDDTFGVIKRLCLENENIKGINFASNFGQHAALMAALRETEGDIVVCLDDDGQTPANEVDKLINKLDEGFDVVYAAYGHKKHSLYRNFGSFVNDLMLCKMLDKPKTLYASSYFAARRYIVDDMLRYENSYPYVMGLVLRATKNVTNVMVEHRDREVGESGYNMKKLLNLWMNGFTAFSVKPLRIATSLGFVSACLGFLVGIYTIVRKFVNPMAPMGYAATMSFIVFFGGMIMFMLGLIGEYIGRIYISINNSPQYVIKERINTGGKQI